MAEVVTLNGPPSDRQVGGDHYRLLTPQPSHVIIDWELPWYLGNAVKYIARCGLKGNRRQDLEKALHYIQLELELMGPETGDG
ncbi:MAG: DUF3310 domain-containing protein [Myxococcota bacterium]|nr:DUF3310 domain-containing protein [Myxococcota bacterium]